MGGGENNPGSLVGTAVGLGVGLMGAAMVIDVLDKGMKKQKKVMKGKQMHSMFRGI